jgi:hypothetical protein
MYMIMFVIDDPALLDSVLDAWQKAGVDGATIVESSGLHRRRATTVGARYSFGFPRVVERVKEGHFTLFVAVNDEAMVQACLDAAETITGDLHEPQTGFFTAWPLYAAKGMERDSAGGSV